MSFEEMRRRAIASDEMDYSEDSALYESQPMFDFTSVALYVPAIQVIVSTVASCVTALILTWIPFGASNAVRTLSIAAVVGLVPILRPIRVARTRGIDALFTMIRPVVVVYLLSMVIEQLGHSCEHWQAQTVGSWREVWYHLVVFVLMLAGFARGYAPRVDNDMPLIVTCVGLILIALVPHSAHEYGGPLCASSSLFHAAERVVRASLFGIVYCVIACAGETLMPRPNGLFVASIRACGASIWILACSVWILPLAVVQVVLVVWSRVRTSETFEPLPLESIENSDVESEVRSEGVGPVTSAIACNVLPSNPTSIVSSVSSYESDVPGFRFTLKGSGGGSGGAPVRPSAEKMRQLAESI